MSKKNRAQGFKVGAHVYIIRPPHNSKRMGAEENSYEKTGVITREGSSANGGWFEVKLDGTKDKLVYYRRGSMELIREGYNYPPINSNVNIQSSVNSPSMYSITSNSSSQATINPSLYSRHNQLDNEPFSLNQSYSSSSVTPRKRTDRDRERDRERHRRKKAKLQQKKFLESSSDDGESFAELSSLEEEEESNAQNVEDNNNDEDYKSSHRLDFLTPKKPFAQSSSNSSVNSMLTRTPLSIGLSPSGRPSLRVLLASEEKDEIEKDFDELISVYSNSENNSLTPAFISSINNAQSKQNPLSTNHSLKRSARKSVPQRSLSGSNEFDEGLYINYKNSNNSNNRSPTDYLMNDIYDLDDSNNICASCRCSSSAIWRECELKLQPQPTGKRVPTVKCLLCDSCSLNYIRFKSNCWRCYYVYNAHQQENTRCPNCRAIHPDLLNHEAAIQFAEQEAHHPLVI